jgi:hypothetical protein
MFFRTIFDLWFFRLPYLWFSGSLGYRSRSFTDRTSRLLIFSWLFFASSSFVILDCYCSVCQVANTITYFSTSFLSVIGPSSVFRFISVCVSPGVLSFCFLQLDSWSLIQYAALLSHSLPLLFSFLVCLSTYKFHFNFYSFIFICLSVFLYLNNS